MPLTPRPARLRPLMLLAVAALAAPATRAETSPYYIGVAETLVHESNLYRISDQQTLRPDLSKSDTYSSLGLVGGVDQTFGRERLYGSIDLRDNRFASNKSLNNNSYGLKLALDWATVERLSGTLSLAADQNLAKFNTNTGINDPIETQKNIARTEQIDAKVRWGVVTTYTLEGALGYRQRSYSAPQYDQDEYNETHASIGFRHRRSGALTLGAALRLSRADYPRFTQSGPDTFESDTLTRQDLDLTAVYTPSDLSQLSVRISPTRIRYDKNTAGDFSGITGSLTGAWQAGGKTRLTANASRDTGQSADAVNLGIFGPGLIDLSQVTTAFKLQADHALTGKVALTGSATYAHRALVETTTSNPFGTLLKTEGSDNTARLAFGARWDITRAAQVGCDLGYERRTSSNLELSVPYTANTFSCYGQIVMQP